MTQKTHANAPRLYTPGEAAARRRYLETWGERMAIARRAGVTSIDRFASENIDPPAVEEIDA